jgi:hypothetical protein
MRRDLHSEVLCLLGTVPTPVNVLAADLGIHVGVARDVCEQLMARGYDVVLGRGGPKRTGANWRTVCVRAEGMAAARADAEAHLKGRDDS